MSENQLVFSGHLEGGQVQRVHCVRPEFSGRLVRRIEGWGRNWMSDIFTGFLGVSSGALLGPDYLYPRNVLCILYSWLHVPCISIK